MKVTMLYSLKETLRAGCLSQRFRGSALQVYRLYSRHSIQYLRVQSGGSAHKGLTLTFELKLLLL